ncbi:ras protein [Dendrothele bispora CBS 962.96]|uniref:Ras protein n=1 Tax=Dendrothele bispora (strain CBS 962.96) TaxID=1314807 RepID=A0A4S8L3D2_DENBC|nr:ras protein [Dendrothele bispora CBS 962.96]
MDRWKVAVLGDGAVGKTALTTQFTSNRFPGVILALFAFSQSTHDPTVQDTYSKQVTVDNEKCRLEVIDTAAPEKYPTLQNDCFLEGQGFILVYSIASRSTFEWLETLRHSIERTLGNGNFIMMVVGNKSDMVSERKVSTEEGAELARQFGCEFIETSAKTTQNVELPFTTLIRALRQTTKMDNDSVKSKRKKHGAACIIV